MARCGAVILTQATTTKGKMKNQIGLIALVAALSWCGCKPATKSAGTDAQADPAQHLLKQRDEARPKAEAAEKRMREAGAGAQVEALGFASAKSLRDQQAASGSKAEAYERYANTAKQIEQKIQVDVQLGAQSQSAADIARFERLQAEVDLARITGQLPAEEKSP